MMIFPNPENMRTVARQLLAISSDVEYVSWPQAGFRVPDEVFDAWESSLPRDEHGDPVVTTEPEPVRVHTNPVTKADIESAAAREEIAAKRKPGRPKKTQGGQ